MSSNNRLHYIVASLIMLVIVLYFYYQGRNTVNMHSYRHLTMDTSVEIMFFGGSNNEAEELKDAVFVEMERLEGLFSRSIEESEISMINLSAGEQPVLVGAEVFSVVEQAITYAELSGGSFDPSIAPIIDLWGFLGQEFRVPAKSKLEEKLPLVDYALIQLNKEESSIFLPEKGMALELGAIAKGYIVDQAIQMLLSAGIEHAFINAGGDIALIGSKPDGTPWKIGVRHPQEENIIVAVIPAVGGAVVTSGDYERVFTEKGVSYHHILKPETGMPADELASVTIVAGSAIKADALSTVVFLIGPVKGMELIERLPEVEGFLITPEHEILVSSGLEEIIELEP